MTRDLIQAALGFQHNYEIVEAESAPVDRCKAYEGGDSSAGPKLVNTTLEKKGLTAAKMRNSIWNKALILKLSKEAQQIWSEAVDGRFGKVPIDWRKLFRDRFQKLFKAI